MLINIGVIGMQYMYYFGMLTGRQNASAAFLQYKKADFFSALAFCIENWQKKRLVDLFTRAKGQAVFFSAFLHRKHPVTKKRRLSFVQNGRSGSCSSASSP